MDGSEPLLLPLNAFLLRPTCHPGTAVTEVAAEVLRFFLVQKGSLDPLADSDLDLLDAAEPGDIVLALSRKPSRAPNWQRFLQMELGLDVITTRESVGAVVFCAIADDEGIADRTRWIAWTFGTGATVIRRRAQDPRFGMLVVLNSLAAASDGESQSTSARGPLLQELRYRSPAPYVQKTGHRAARGTPLEGFRMDQSMDLLAAVGSSDAVPAFSTSTLLGGRSLRFRARVDQIEDLVRLADTAFERWRLRNYRDEFTWVDNIQPVEDETLIDRLRAHVADTLVTDPESPTLDVILPDDLLEVDGDRSICKIALPQERGASHGRMTLTTGILAGLLGRVEPAHRSRFLERDLRFFDEADQKIGVATILECLSAEFYFAGTHYIAYDGDFFQVQDDYVSRVDRELGQIPESQLDFPVYKGESERAYNTKVGRDCPTRFICLDRMLVRVPGETTFEACDLISSSGAFVHVKRKGKSSTLSHLFLQAANSCELLRRSREAWTLFGSLLADKAPMPETLATVQKALAVASATRDELEVVFAFLGDWKGKTIKQLPLFSRISLVNASKRVRSLGFRATVKTLSTR